MFHSDFEEKLPYSVLTFVALAVFYAIYFGKMLARRNSRTRQDGDRDDGHLCLQPQPGVSGL